MWRRRIIGVSGAPQRNGDAHAGAAARISAHRCAQRKANRLKARGSWRSEISRRSQLTAKAGENGYLAAA